MKKLTRTKKITAIISTFSILSCATVMAAPVSTPDAGSIFRGQQGNTPAMPEKQASSIEVGGQQKEVASVAVGPKFPVNGFHITGQSIFTEDKLVSLISDSAGKELTLVEVQGLADRITKYLHDQGYLVAKAYVPAQDIKDGVVEITVIVGQYGKINIRNHSGLKDGVAVGLLSSLKSGDYVKKDILERTLLIFNDTAGISVKTTLVPGKNAGMADLVVDISDIVKTNGQISADNWGNRFTGKNRINFNMDINNPSGAGDLVNLSGAYAGSGMNDYSASYILSTGGQGAKLGVGYSEMHYALGQDFVNLNANGVAKTTSIFETFVLARSRDFNLNARIGYDSKQLVDRIDSVPSTSDKRDGVWSIGVSGNSSDQFGSGGMNSFALTYSSGHLGLKSVDAVKNDANAQTAGGYKKSNLILNRVQAMSDRVNMYLSFTGQLANKNLDSSEKLQIGGSTGVRAYPIGEAPSDEGYIFTGEFRWNMPTPSFQLAAFYDNGKAVLNKSPWAGAGVNNRSLSGAGLGLIWNRRSDYSIRLDYAWKISTSDLATSDTDKNGRLWLQATKYF